MLWAAAATSRPITQRRSGAFVVTGSTPPKYPRIHLSRASIISVQLCILILRQPSFNRLVGRRTGDFQFFSDTCLNLLC
ncbi:hypothetical protein BDR05DRAFT_968897 [Suillus weaverae]|nr:hypothetical protein BDR05DRAFT_968897 [Suillus weaverae]